MDSISSTLKSAHTVALVFSSLGAHGRFRDPELPGTWFVAALTPLGHHAAAIRQALFRMEKRGEVVSRKQGRTKWYRLSEYGQAAVDSTYRKMTTPREEGWDGLWTVVTYQFAVEQRTAREKLRWVMELEGFGLLARGVYVHPRDRWKPVKRAIEAIESGPSIHGFRGARLDGEEDAALVQRLWALGAIDGKYRGLLEVFRPFLSRDLSDPSTCFALRLALAIRYSEISWGDPELPAELLPADWSGFEARDMMQELYSRTIEGTLKHGDRLLEGG